MIQVNFLKNGASVTVPVQQITTCPVNDVFVIGLEFMTDEDARDAETLLKTRGFKTEHTDKAIRVFETDTFGLIVN